MVSVKTAIYKEFTGKSTINLIFAISLLLKSLIYCKIAKNFDHDSDHQPIHILKIKNKAIKSLRALSSVADSI